MAAFDRVACLFSVSHLSVAQFVLARCSPDSPRTSPASSAWCPLCQTSYNVQNHKLLLIAKLNSTALNRSTFYKVL